MTLLYDWLKKAAKVQGNNKAVVYRDNYLSWRGLLHRVDRRAQEFKSMGIKEGAWVGLMLGNVPDFVILALALSRLDAAIVPIDPTTGGRELELAQHVVAQRDGVGERLEDLLIHERIIPFTLLSSRFSVRVQVRGEVRGFFVLGSRFGS